MGFSIYLRLISFDFKTTADVQIKMVHWLWFGSMPIKNLCAARRFSFDGQSFLIFSQE